MGIFGGTPKREDEVKPRPKSWEEATEAAVEDHPELVAELVRLHAWASVCIGEDVAKWGGLAVDRNKE